jgi:hypothetical protein
VLASGGAIREVAGLGDATRAAPTGLEDADVKQQRATELRDAWGDAACDHPQLAKLYDKGVPTGSFACTQCGRAFSFREKAELAATRRD